MKTTYVIDVTRDDIEQGKPGRATRCAVALAARRAMSVPSVVVGHDRIEVEASRFLLPCEAEEWIQHFDDDADVEPIRFTVERES